MVASTNVSKGMSRCLSFFTVEMVSFLEISRELEGEELSWG